MGKVGLVKTNVDTAPGCAKMSLRELKYRDASQKTPMSCCLLLPTLPSWTHGQEGRF